MIEVIHCLFRNGIEVKKLILTRCQHCAIVQTLTPCQFCRQTFLYAFLPLMFGLYPYTAATDKQKAAMEKAGMEYRPASAYALAYAGIRVLKGLQE